MVIEVLASAVFLMLLRLANLRMALISKFPWMSPKFEGSRLSTEIKLVPGKNTSMPDCGFLRKCFSKILGTNSKSFSSFVQFSKYLDCSSL